MNECITQDIFTITKSNTLESKLKSNVIENFSLPSRTENREKSKLKRIIVLGLVLVVFTVVLVLSIYVIYFNCSHTTCDNIHLTKVKKSPDFEKYPWIARIISEIYNETSFTCTAFFVSARFALTAAHCIDFDDDWKIKELYLGGTAENDFNDTLKIPADELIMLIHPEYNNDTELNDIALIKFKNPVTTSKTVYPVRLPFDHPNIPETLTLTGWISENTMKNPQLKEEVIPVITEEECKKIISKPFENKTLESGIIPIRFCAGDKETIINKGDSGSALVLMDTNGPIAFGITSLGKKEEYDKKHVLIPGLFTNIYPYLDWILCNGEDNLNNKGCNDK